MVCVDVFWLVFPSIVVVRVDVTVVVFVPLADVATRVVVRSVQLSAGRGGELAAVDAGPAVAVDARDGALAARSDARWGAVLDPRRC